MIKITITVTKPDSVGDPELEKIIEQAMAMGAEVELLGEVLPARGAIPTPKEMTIQAPHGPGSSTREISTTTLKEGRCGVPR